MVWFGYTKHVSSPKLQNPSPARREFVVDDCEPPTARGLEFSLTYPCQIVSSIFPSLDDGIRL